jgi:hypothetical protein
MSCPSHPSSRFNYYFKTSINVSDILGKGKDKGKSNSITGLERPRVFREVEAPILKEIGTGKWYSC